MQSGNSALAQQVDCSRNGTNASQFVKCGQALGTGAARILSREILHQERGLIVNSINPDSKATCLMMSCMTPH